MAARIKILPSSVIDQIAAGEVVERPASVVKELVENSLDAGAGRVTCRVEEGGRTLVEVTDDGEGMSAEDASLAVERHATSKIATGDDLQSIATLGFRGEALSSIAAVSRVQIVTRRDQDEAATSLVLEAGRQVEKGQTGAPVGTRIRVSDLFFNVPARRKFLRTVPTEMSHIQAWMTRLGLARPGIHLTLLHGKRKLLDCPATADPAQRASAILGRDVFEHLFVVDHKGGELAVHGLVSDPHLTRSNTKGMHVFVNGRFVRDRLLQHSIMDAYQTVIAQGRFPVVVLDIRLDPRMVDVNVHPQKTEVRFSDTRRVHRALSTAIAEVLSRSPWLKSTRKYVLQRDAAPASAEAERRAARVRESLERYGSSRRTGFSAPKGPAPRRTQEGGQEPREDAGGAGLSQWKLVGSLWNTYLLLASGDELVIVDQHAAAERITFERLREQAAERRVSTQRLLVPIQLDLASDAAALLDEHGARLSDLGFEVEPFGETTVNITAVPALLARAPVAPLVRDVLDELSEMGADTAWERARSEVLGRMACHASLRAGRALPETEIRALLEQLEKIDFSGTCPHGRPVQVSFSASEVEHWFHRT